MWLLRCGDLTGVSGSEGGGGDEGEGLGLGVDERTRGGGLGDSSLTSAILDSCSYVVPSLYIQ